MVRQEVGGPEAEEAALGQPLYQSGLTDFYHILSLQSLLTLDHLEFHFVILGQRAEPFALDGAMVDEDIGAVFTGNKADPLGISKPFNPTCFLHAKTSPTKM